MGKISQKKMNSQSTYAPTISQPIFLVGAERSGTTLLRLMLKHHPQIAWCPESKYMVDLRSENNEFPDLSDYYRFLEDDFIFQHEFNFHIDRSLTYPELLHSFPYQTITKICQSRTRCHQKILPKMTINSMITEEKP